jgi:hypothetical protein
VTRDEALAWGRAPKGRRAPRIATRDFPAEVLALVYARLGHRTCVDCLELGCDDERPDDVQLQVDHMQPLARGGDNHHLNLTIRCADHNRSKSDRSATAAPRRPKWERRRA